MLMGYTMLKKRYSNILFIIVAETCKCKKVIYTNYYNNPPYVQNSGNTQGVPGGIFPAILKDLIPETCGTCDQITSNHSTEIDFSQNGKNQFAKKRNVDRVLDDIDDFTQLSFQITSIADITGSNDFVFVGVIKYPGAIFLVRKPSTSEHVEKLVGEVFKVLPVLFIDFLMIILAGLIIWALVSYFSLVIFFTFYKFRLSFL